MKLFADLHTHSKNCRFGHGKSTIEEMAIAANELGLVEIGITDHAYKHFFRTTKQKMIEARKTINEINEWSKTKVLLGIEADIIDEDGTLDIDNETLSMLDILVVGYHRMTWTNFAGYFGGMKDTAEAKRKATNAFVNAIKKYPVTILAHLDSILKTDMYEIGKACAERGTLVEINNRHTHWTREQMEDLIASGCTFVVSSDAHSRDKVGFVDDALELIRKYDIPSERIANVEFTEEEKSEIDREYEAYKSIYAKVTREKEAFEEKIEEERISAASGTLSKEMEDELMKIAQERGIEIEERRPRQADVYEGYINENMDENAQLIAMAEEYIRNARMNEFDQENEGLGDGNYDYAAEEEKYLNNGETLSVEEDIPLMKDDGFQNKFQAINNLVQDAREGKDERKPLPEREVKTSANNSRVEINRTPAKKKAEAVEIQNTAAKKEPRVVEPENFMSSITRTNLAASQGNQPAQKPEAEKPKKTVTRRKNSGGFIAVDDLLDGQK